MAVIIVYMSNWKLYIFSNDNIESGSAIRTSLTCFYHAYNKSYCLMKQNLKKISKNGILKISHF